MTNFKIGQVGALQFYQLFRQGATLLTAILLVKIGLSSEAIGAYEQLLYIGFVLSFFWTTGLIQGFLSLFPQKDQKEQKNFFFNAYLLFLSLSLSLFLLCFFFQTEILQFLVQQASLPYFLLFILYFCINLPTVIIEYFLYLKSWSRFIIWLGSITFVTQVLIMILPVFFGYPFLYSFYGLIGLAILKHSILILFLLREATWSINIRLVKKWGIVSLPLLLYAFQGGATQAFDSWLVNYIFPGDDQMFAIFRYGSREVPLAIILTSAFSNAFIPNISKNLQDGMLSIKQKSIQLMHFLFPISILLLLTSYFWFPLVFNKEYLASIPIFNVLILITISRVIFPHTILIGLGKSQILVSISIIELLINVGASILLVQYYGLWGIAMGSVIAYSMEKVMHVIYLSWKLKIKLQQYIALKWLVFYSILLLAAYCLILVVFE